MWHWRASSCVGFLLTGRFRPLCSIVHCLPDCRPKAAFSQATNRYFNETRHLGRMHDTYVICAMLRGPLA